jgi:hypothetical protein
MIVKLFKPEFAEKIRAGIKRSTIRPRPERWPQIWTPISLRQWSGKPYRSPQIILATATITAARYCTVRAGSIEIDRRELDYCDLCALAAKEGFDDFAQMLFWFIRNHQLPLDGILIEWSEPQVHGTGRNNVGAHGTICD